MQLFDMTIFFAPAAARAMASLNNRYAYLLFKAFFNLLRKREEEK